ncbi:phosphorylase family protein [Hyperthermus butylicus DSM 5456]|uniref:Phosphorylase family protein n=1 Tax=Hyperthermus butylicus (strain DSM 5456 / JCM 9403 / PLM1-5) TaxID=415426 RepID=A2BKF9_HYPBU|nr:phosphorylase family protein [Hyperthermus butylicus DSM 5456]
MRMLGAVKLSGWLFKSFMGVYRGKEVLVALPYPGSPDAVAVLEVLAAMGGSVFVVVGRVGAIHPTLSVGDVFVPTWGLREEGVSFHYVPDTDFIPKPDAELADALYRRAIGLKGEEEN